MGDEREELVCQLMLNSLNAPDEKKAFFNKIDSKYTAKTESEKTVTDTGKKKTPVDTKPTIEYTK